MAGVYVHVPYCRSKCGYCAFNSRPLPDTATLDGYLDALLTELSMRQAALGRHRLDTIYFGGGTPSLIAPAAIGKLIEKIRACTTSTPAEIEITLEANPETLTAKALSQYRAVGVNRLSLGVQSFDEDALKFLDRKHTPGQAALVYRQARDAGFTNISLDFIIGLPSPNDYAFLGDLRFAIELAPEHLSVYLLTVEEPSRLFDRIKKREIKMPEQETQADIYLDCHALLTEAGFEHYEVSNYGKPGFRSRHNSAYWLGDAYLGFGAGAHSYLNQGFKPQRWGNVEDPVRYVEAMKKGDPPLAFVEEITPTMALQEELMLRLRTAEGVDTASFGEYGPDLAEKLAEMVEQGWYTRMGNRFYPTAAGLLVADGVALELWELFAEEE